MYNSTTTWQAELYAATWDWFFFLKTKAVATGRTGSYGWRFLFFFIPLCVITMQLSIHKNYNLFEITVSHHGPDFKWKTLGNKLHTPYGGLIMPDGGFWTIQVLGDTSGEPREDNPEEDERMRNSLRKVSRKLKTSTTVWCCCFYLL